MSSPTLPAVSSVPNDDASRTPAPYPVADAVLLFADQLTVESKLTILRGLTKSLDTEHGAPDYVVYNTGYTNRLCNDHVIDRILTYMDKHDMESKILYIWNDSSEEPYFNVCPNSKRSEHLQEHPEGRATFAALRSVTRPGILVKRYDSQLLAFIKAVLQCEHCGCLAPDPYNVERTYALVGGEVKTILVLDFDTVSG